jgi:hypothetical protein
MATTLGFDGGGVLSTAIDFWHHPRGGSRVDEQAIRQYFESTFAGVDVDVGSKESGAPEIAWGDTFFIYDPRRKFEGARRFPFATIVIKSRRRAPAEHRRQQEDVSAPVTR